MRRRTYLGALGALTVTSGCLRLSSDESTSPTRVSNGTQASTTTATERTTTSEIDPFPPYVSADGVTEGLADYYRDYVSRRSFTIDYAQTNLVDGSVSAWQVRYADGNAVKETRTGSNLEMYSGENAPYWRQLVSDGYTYGRAKDWSKPPAGRTRENYLTKRAMLENLIRGGDWASATLRDDGSALVTATAVETPVYLTNRYGATAINAFDGEMLVTENGVIADLDVEVAYDPNGSDDEQRVRERITTTGVGSTTIREPSWYDLAIQRAPNVTATLTSDESAIELTHTAGNAILPGTGVDLNRQDGLGHVGGTTVQEPIEPGQTWYVWHDTNRLRLTRTPPGAGDTVDPLDDTYVLWAKRRFAEYFGVVKLE